MSTMTVSYAPGGAHRPFIRLANRHLLKSGFFIGSKFNVEYANDIIILKKIKDQYEHSNNVQAPPHSVPLSTSTTGAKEDI